MEQQRAEALADASAFFVGGGSAPKLGARRRNIIGVMLLLATLAGATAKAPSIPARQPSGLLWLVFDPSPTMRTRDLPGGRFDFAKFVAARLIEQWHGRVRISTIGGDEDVVLPATSDSRRAMRAATSLTVHPAARDPRALVLDHGLPLDESFWGVVFSDGNRLDVPRLAPNNDGNGHWIVVGLGTSSQSTPVPDGDGGWLMQRGRMVESKRDDEKLAALTAALKGTCLPATADAGAMSDRIRSSKSALGVNPAIDVMPVRMASWLAVTAFVAFIGPWRWVAARAKVLATATILIGPTWAGAQDYGAARGLLAKGRWRDAEEAFQRLIPGDVGDPNLPWGLGVAAAGLASETSEPIERRRLVGVAIEALHKAETRASSPADREELQWNIAVAKRSLAGEETHKKPGLETTVTAKTPKGGGDASASDAKGDPAVERRAGTEIGGGAVERPIAGLSVSDPGPVNRATAESIINRVAKSSESTSLPSRSSPAPKRR